MSIGRLPFHSLSISSPLNGRHSDVVGALYILFTNNDQYPASSCNCQTFTILRSGLRVASQPHTWYLVFISYVSIRYCFTTPSVVVRQTVSITYAVMCCEKHR